MDIIPIAELHPELPARDSTHFKAAVTLIWPYSSSQRQFALLLAEPDFRLRRKKGQVRARFSGSSARALATTGVGIGDQVVLSLRGARFVQEGTVSTPGRSIDWELEYKQNVSVQVFRDGSEIANLELVDAAPTPAPRSPRRPSDIAPSPTQQWSSPAFLKRIRLSDGPFFEATYDPLLDENAEAHDRKRRRRSYRDWKTWTYNARTPSPEKGEAGVDDDLESMEPSPTHRTQLPRTPISPPRPSALSVAAAPVQDDEEPTADAQNVESEISVNLDGADDRHVVSCKSAQHSTADDFERDEVYYDLYAGPEESRPMDTQYAFGGDTEANTEEDDMEDTDAASTGSTEVNSEEIAIGYLHDDSHVSPMPAFPVASAGSTTEEGSLVEIPDPQHREASSDKEEASGSLKRAERAPILVMPPPILPTLNTDLQAPIITTGTLTPIGIEPRSPTLQPLDSALLPLPSPFPGEADMNSASYFDHVTNDTQPKTPQQAEEEPPIEADYILENSFFSSINSAAASILHPDHESAFTPLRFTFGMDNIGFPKPMELSSPPPQNVRVDDHDVRHSGEEGKTFDKTLSEPSMDLEVFEDQQDAVSAQEEVPAPAVHLNSPSHDEVEGLSSALHSVDNNKDESSVIELSSVVEEESEDGEEEEESVIDEGLAVDSVNKGREIFEIVDSMGEKLHVEDPVLENRALPDSSAQTAVSEVVDLGSPLDDSKVEDDLTSPQEHHNHEDTAEQNLSEELSSTGRIAQPAEGIFSTLGTLGEDQSEVGMMEIAPANLDVFADAQDEINHMPTQQEMQTTTLPDLQVPEHLQQSSAMDTTDTYMEDNFLQWGTHNMEEHHPDVKMESIEEPFASQYNDSGMHEEAAGSLADAPGEMLIEIPDEGHKVGELHTIAVPATGPARNTRSKTKTSATSMSPTKEEFSPLQRTTRSTRSKASATPIARTTMSPPRTRTRSTTSPGHDLSQTSPYSLRSQSKLLSPTQSTFVEPTARRSPRKHASQRSVDSVPDMQSSQVLELDPPLTSFQPSQELGGSQGRYSYVAAIKDSEDESLRSEHSISTVRYSDDWNTFNHFSDPVVETEQGIDATNLKPPHASAPEARVTPGSRVKAVVSEGTTRSSDRNSPADVRFSFTSQAALVSPGRKLRSASSMEAEPISPRVLRSTRHSVRMSSSPAARDLSEEATPKAQEVAYPALPGEGEIIDIQSSPPASGNIDDAIRSSPPPTVITTPTRRRTRAQGTNRPVTPDLSQGTAMESQDPVVAAQQHQSALLTPQLTQVTSAGLQSFNASMEDASTLIATPTKPSPNAVTRSTPRRNATQTDVASPSTTPPIAQSPDHSSEDMTAVEQPEGPSIGLSTPLAYYTPLNSMTYFLNRSSQFHTSSNPDVLALVTSSTTTLVRATKGRKDWSTTLHITDLSTWPSATTVNLFRPYQSALPTADAGDVILLRACAVKSLNRHPTLTSADESSWCVWRYGKPVWGAKRGKFGELKAREEMKGPVVERGEGEWREVERLREWWVGTVKEQVEEKVKTRSQDKEEARVNGGEGVVTRSRDKKVEESEADM